MYAVFRRVRRVCPLINIALYWNRIRITFGCLIIEMSLQGSVVWGEKLLVSLVRGTGRTTREYIRRLVNTLDDLYQAAVLDILERSFYW